jgi:hypothetical protein
LYSEKGLSWLADFGYKGRACELTAAQQDALKTWVTQTLPRTTTMVGEWIEKSYGVSYTRSALIKLLQRNDMEYRKPKLVPRKLDPAKQRHLSTVMKICLTISPMMKLWCSLMPRIRRTNYGRPAVGHLRIQGSRLKGRAGGNA